MLMLSFIKSCYHIKFILVFWISHIHLLSSLSKQTDQKQMTLCLLSRKTITVDFHLTLSSFLTVRETCQLAVLGPRWCRALCHLTGSQMNQQTDRPRPCPSPALCSLLSACPVPLPLWLYSPNCSEPCRDGRLRARLGGDFMAEDPSKTFSPTHCFISG